MPQRQLSKTTRGRVDALALLPLIMVLGGCTGSETSEPDIEAAGQEESTKTNVLEAGYPAYPWR
ncbi:MULTISPECIES: hypothetical protein [Marinobacter]|uniref:hypothetical protein n=1 Tax=Marinobacter TaxID=2742 RepID=UPI001244E993|nr:MULTISPECIES: hypothetical protein [Marinobacter]MBL3557723.1 hypothetical protein [Marinobacter sp. JB05H06]